MIYRGLNLNERLASTRRISGAVNTLLNRDERAVTEMDVVQNGITFVWMDKKYTVSTMLKATSESGEGADTKLLEILLFNYFFGI